MDDFTIYCTEEQTRKAIKLGAPIEICDTEIDIENRNIGSMLREEDFLCNIVKLEDYLYDIEGNRLERNVIVDGTEETGRIVAFAPTGEQLIGWLEDQDDIEEITVLRNRAFHSWSYIITNKRNKIISINNRYRSRKEATLAAIDAALEYLSNYVR